jgi:hypothetical protein
MLQEIMIYTYILISVKHGRSHALKAQSIKKKVHEHKPGSRRNIWSTFLHTYYNDFIHITCTLRDYIENMFENKNGT